METSATNGAPIVLGLAVGALAIILYFTGTVAPEYAVAGFVLASAAPVAGLVKFGRVAFAIMAAMAILALVVGVVTR